MKKMLWTAVVVGLTNARAAEWEDPAVNSENRLPACAYLAPLADEAAATNRDGFGVKFSADRPLNNYLLKAKPETWTLRLDPVARASAALAAPLDALETWFAAEARSAVAGCAHRTADGLTAYAPDASGHYKAAWLRDFAMMLEGDAVPHAQIVPNVLRAADPECPP